MTQANPSYSNFESNRWYYVSHDGCPESTIEKTTEVGPDDYTNGIAPDSQVKSMCDEVSISDHYVNVWKRGWDICKPASKWSKYHKG